MTPDTLISRLQGVRQFGTDRWSARCPAHEDSSPSLSVRLTDDRVLIHCFAGCAPDDILAAVGLSWRDLFADQWKAAEHAQHARGHLRAKVLDSRISDRDRAAWIVRLAAEDLRRGRQHSLEDRAALAQALYVLEGCPHG